MSNRVRQDHAQQRQLQREYSNSCYGIFSLHNHVVLATNRHEEHQHCSHRPSTYLPLPSFLHEYDRKQYHICPGKNQLFVSMRYSDFLSSQYMLDEKLFQHQSFLYLPLFQTVLSCSLMLYDVLPMALLLKTTTYVFHLAFVLILHPNHLGNPCRAFHQLHRAPMFSHVINRFFCV